MDDYPLLPAKYDEVDWIAQLMNGKSAMEVIDGFRLSSFHRDDHIALSYSRSLGRSARINPDNLDAVSILHVVKSGQTAIQLPLQGREPQESAAHPSVDKDFRYNPYGGVGRNGEADSLGDGNYGCIHADNPPSGIDKRTT
jgi:hypothetical protein